MLELAGIEAFKLRRGLAVKVMAGLTAVYAMLIVGVYRLMEVMLDLTDTELPQAAGMPVTIHLTGLTAFQGSDMYSMLQIFMMVLVASLYSSEYGRSTLKVMLVGGTSRTRLYLSKFLVLAGVLFGYSLLGAVLVTALATVFNGWGGSFEPMQLVGLVGASARITVLSLSYAAMLAAAAILTKSTGIVIAIGIGLQFAESILTTLLQVIDNAVVDFLADLLPTAYAIRFAGLDVEPGILLRGVAVSVVLAAVFLWFGIRQFNRQDISA